LYEFLGILNTQGRDAAAAYLGTDYIHSEYNVETSNNVQSLAIARYLDPSAYLTVTMSNWGTAVYSNLMVTVGLIPDALSGAGGPILYLGFSNFYFSNILAIYNNANAAGFYTKTDAELAASSNADDHLALEVKQVLQVMQAFFDNLKDPSIIKGVIVDVRGNGGGNVNDLSYLWGKMIASPHTMAYSRAKLGDNRLDYGPWMPDVIYPDEASLADFTKPIVLLMNKGSVSCSEMSVMFVASLPNGYTIGGTSWGGHGLLGDSRMLNGGQFEAPCITLCYTPSVQTKNLDGVIYEGRGIPPKIAVPFDEAAFQAFKAGEDTRLDAALRCIKEHE
jgi:hypothetical protein